MYKLVPKDQLDPAQMTKYGIGSIAFGTIMAWNTETVGKKGPDNWTEFFDKKAFLRPPRALCPSEADARNHADG